MPTVLRRRARQLRALLRHHPPQICSTHHFIAVRCVQIVVNISYCSIEGYTANAIPPFCLTSFTPRGRDPFHCSLGGSAKTCTLRVKQDWLRAAFPSIGKFAIEIPDAPRSAAFHGRQRRNDSVDLRVLGLVLEATDCFKIVIQTLSDPAMLLKLAKFPQNITRATETLYYGQSDSAAAIITV